MTCMDAKTGEQVWRQRLEGSFSASPIYANDRIYLFNEDARSFILKPGRQFEVLATNSLEEDVLVATPAVSDRSLFIRTEKHLYRIEKTSAK